MNERNRTIANHKSRFIITSCLYALVILSCYGCQERLTQRQWESQYKPADPNQAEAMAILKERTIAAESKAESLARVDKFKMACAAGFVASIVAIGVGIWLRMKVAYAIGSISAIACLSGYGLMLADVNYGRYLGLGGLLLSLLVCAMTIYVAVRALIQVIKGNEIFKGITASDSTKLEVLNDFKDAQRQIQGGTTEKIVDGIRGENE